MHGFYGCSRNSRPNVCVELYDLLGTEAVAAVLGALDIFKLGCDGKNIEPPLKDCARQ